MDTTLGKRISAYRKKLGLTQDQLADKLGLTAQAVSKWENDLSCPDITILPKLADIFSVTTDELLGRETGNIGVSIANTEVKQEQTPTFEFDSDTGKMDFHWDGIKLEGFSLACWVMLTGVILLAKELLQIEVTFWNILWPSFLFVFGAFGIYPRFSVFRLGCCLIGCYFLLDKLYLLNFPIHKGILLAVCVLLFGLSLLLDTLRKQKYRGRKARYQDFTGKIHHGKICNVYNVEGNSFSYDASFGSNFQSVEMEALLSGHVSTNFGDYTVDLSGVKALEAGCKIHADCSFGELTILVPRRFTILPDSSTSFASFEIHGQPDAATSGSISLHTMSALVASQLNTCKNLPVFLYPQGKPALFL